MATMSSRKTLRGNDDGSERGLQKSEVCLDQEAGFSVTIVVCVRVNKSLALG